MAGRLEARIIKRIEEKFIDKFDIKTTRVRNETGLPEKCYKVDLDDPFYFSDIIFRDKKTEKITHIIEIETDPVRKSLVGAAITADYCIGIDQPKDKVNLFFVIGKKGSRQIKDFKRRVPIIEKYIRYINKPVLIDTEEEIFCALSGVTT